MVDTDRIIEILPHYVAMVILITVILALIRTTIGELGFVIEVLLVLPIVFAYPFIARRLGIAPSGWD